MILALELVKSAGDVASAYLGHFVPPIGAVSVAVADPRLVHASDPVVALELLGRAW